MEPLPPLLEAPPPRPAIPTGEGERLEILDVLRGFAVLGILIMNIQAFSMVTAAYSNPTNYGDLSGANFLVWFFSSLLFNQKLMALFSILFGAGIVLMAERVQARGGQPWRLHYRRMGWLLLIGLLHAHLLWFGDILFSYALCAMILFACWKLSPTRQLALALALLALPVVFLLTLAATLPHLPEDAVLQITHSWSPPAADLLRETAAYRGGWLEQMSLRPMVTLSYQTSVFVVYTFGRAGGLMLLGMALFRWGVLTGRADRRVYRLLIVAGFFVGFPMVLTGLVLDINNGWAAEISMVFGVLFNYWGSILVCLAYLSAIVLLHRGGYLRWLWRVLVPPGRMALTCYLGQTLLCTTLFYGHGFGLFGKVERVEQLILTLAIWVLLLAFSHGWLEYFRFGPFEWLWRSLTYGRWQPLRRRG